MLPYRYMVGVGVVEVEVEAEVEVWGCLATPPQHPTHLSQSTRTRSLTSDEHPCNGTLRWAGSRLLVGSLLVLSRRNGKGAVGSRSIAFGSMQLSVVGVAIVIYHI